MNDVIMEVEREKLKLATDVMRSQHKLVLWKFDLEMDVLHAKHTVKLDAEFDSRMVDRAEGLAVHQLKCVRLEMEIDEINAKIAERKEKIRSAAAP